MSTETDDRRGSFVRIAGLTYGTNLAVAILSLLNVIITARSLGPTGRGEIALLTTIAMLTASLAALGIHEANANIGGAEPNRRMGARARGRASGRHTAPRAGARR